MPVIVAASPAHNPRHRSVAPTHAVVGRDPWIRRLVFALVASIVLAAALWGAATVSLRDSAQELGAFTASRSATN